jgi:hypothetical protein
VKRNSALCLLLVGCLLMLVACGGSSSSSKPSGLTTRAFASNSFNGTINIINFTNDHLSTSTIGSAGQPGPILVSADHSTTLVIDSAANTATVITNSTEKVAGTITLPTNSSILYSYNSFAISSDGTVAWVAVRNGIVSGQPSGLVARLDLVNIDVSNTFPVPNALHVALSNDNSTLLAFSDNSNNVTVINNSALTATTVPPAASVLDHPVAAYFSADDSTAFILSCGAGCGGTNAGVTPYASPSLAGQTFGAMVPLPAANIGLLNAGTLYVVGQAATNISGTITTSSGVFTPVNVSNELAPVAGTPLPLANTGNSGTPNSLALNGNDLFVGSSQCTAGNICLAVVDVSANALVAPANTQNCTLELGCNVTGLASIPNRSGVYVAGGGDLFDVNPTTGQISTATQINIAGSIKDVAIVDP